MIQMKVTSDMGVRSHDAQDIEIQVFDADGSPTSLAGLNLRWVMRGQWNWPDMLEKVTADGGITLKDGDATTCIVHIEGGELPEPGDYWHALRDDTGVKMLGAGDIHIGPGIAAQVVE